MAEYIKRSDLIGNFPYNISFCDEGDIYNWINTIPSADVRENVHGEWLLTLSDVYDFYKCSVCGHTIEAPGGVPDENFCPNCGADMRGTK